ncbi:hypothetical protein [Haliangium sp.]|uniref:hypothetical protein n=1 Tax=Haliangium sp. TaxID=2663208 RepID=UPI003D0FD092
MRLEDLQPDARVHGLSADGPVTIKSVTWRGDDAVEIIFTDAAGALHQRLVFRGDEPALSADPEQQPWTFAGDGALRWVVSEAYRIRLAWLFDPYVAITTATIEPLPH